MSVPRRVLGFSIVVARRMCRANVCSEPVLNVSIRILVRPSNVRRGIITPRGIKSTLIFSVTTRLGPTLRLSPMSIVVIPLTCGRSR